MRKFSRIYLVSGINNIIFSSIFFIPDLCIWDYKNHFFTHAHRTNLQRCYKPTYITFAKNTILIETCLISKSSNRALFLKRTREWCPLLLPPFIWLVVMVTRWTWKDFWVVSFIHPLFFAGSPALTFLFFIISFDYF